tara:strand:- start:3169 stop:3915 length:747 start_codon:yes stop_codon:yes gene_type:complete
MALERNGREDRFREIRVSSILGGIGGAYLMLCFLVPMAMPEGSVPQLSGRANALDYATEDSWGNTNGGENDEVGHDQILNGGLFAWRDLNPIFAFTYAFGDLNCHQKHERSWEINGNQMPVCARDIGIFLGFVIGAALFGSRGLNRWTTRDTFLSVFPDELLENTYANDKRMSSMIILLSLGIVPMAIDGFTQLLTDYESVNPLRLATGMAAGLVVGWFICASLCARATGFEGASSVILPNGAKLIQK